MSSSTLVTLLHVTTAVVQIGMNLSPAPDMYRVHKSKTTGQMALLPLVLMCFNNHLWLLYGLLTKSIFPLSAAALAGEIAGVIFTSVYYRWARNTLEARRTCSAAFLGMVLVTLYVFLGVAGETGQSYDQVVQSLGYVGATINICMYASPLATIKVVLETKSSASLPINLCTMICLNCCMWVATSIVDNDMFVLIPSVIGLVFSGVQLPLYFIYRETNPYIDVDTWLEEGYGTSTTNTVDSFKYELDHESVLPTTYRTTRSTVEMTGTAEIVIRSMAACSGTVMILSPSILIYRVSKQKDVGVASVIPLVTLFANCHVWAVYGYMIENWFPIFWIYLFGDAVALVFLSVYWRYTRQRRYVNRVLLTMAAIVAFVTIYAIIGGLGYTGQSRDQMGSVMGIFADISAICMYGAPMEKLLQVLKYRSAAFINAHMVIAGLTNNCLWFT
ncbi:MtN3-like protein, partial [Phytophthora palmivora]